MRKVPQDVSSELLLTSDDCKSLVVTRVAQDKTGTRSNSFALDILFGHIQGNWHGEEVTIRETESINDTLVVSLVHEALQRAEATVDDELQIA